MHKDTRIAFLACLVGLFALTARAQWMTQTLNLRAGWNAVFIEVLPDPAHCDTLFAGKPIDSVWAWNRRFSTMQYVDARTLVPGQPDWLTWLPAANPARAAVNLFLIQGGRPYLIKTTSATTLTLTGTPVIRNTDWLTDSFNLAGFYVSSNSPPNFYNYFAPSPAHDGQPLYRLNASGAWERIISPSQTLVNRGESYWVLSQGYSSYPGPMKLSFEQGRGLDFGRTLTELTLRIKNTSSNQTTFTVRKLPSGAPPNTNYPALAGDVPLSYWVLNLATNQTSWLPLPAALTSSSMAPGSEWSLRLAVRRADMAAFSLPAGYADSAYQSLLEVTDTAGSRQVVPVSSAGFQPSAANRQLLARPQSSPLSASSDSDPRAGLWVGNAVIHQVNQAATGSSVPLDTALDFQFRLLIHVAANGDINLLQKVVLGWTNGVYATNNAGLKNVLLPGCFVLLTDDSKISRFSGSVVRDGIVTGRRLSSAAFGFDRPVSIFPQNPSVRFGQTNTQFKCNVLLGYDDGLNPFKHVFHPDHNNLDDSYQPLEVKTNGYLLTYTDESLSVNRLITLQFAATDPDHLSIPGWGDNQLGGTYDEVITGLHKNPIHAVGTFHLFHASDVPVLNNLPL